MTAAGLKALLQAPVEKEKARNAEEKDNGTRRAERLRQANRCFIICLENQIRAGCGAPLTRFLPATKAGALVGTEERYHTEAVDPLTGQQRRRSCIIDRQSGQRRFELPVQAAGVRACPVAFLGRASGLQGRPG